MNTFLKLPHDVRLAITTHKRATVEQQWTLAEFMAARIRPLELVVQASQEQAYCKMLNSLKAIDYVSVTVLPKEITRLYTTRQWLLDDTRERGQTRVLLFDDDIGFDTRRDTIGHYRKSEPEDVRRMIRTLAETVRHYAHAGIGSRQGSGYASRAAQVERQNGLTVVGRMSRALAYNVRMCAKLDARYDRIDFVDDFQMTLDLLTKGEPNAIWYEWVQGERGGFNAPGGCSTQRTMEKLQQAQNWLKKRFPDVVDFVEKQYKTTEARREVRISWQKAFGKQNMLSSEEVNKSATEIRQRAKSF